MVQNMGNDPRKKINMAAGLAAAIHLPRCPDPNSPSKGLDGMTPLYPYGSESRRTAQHSPKWLQMCGSTYNSPSNVRVVCLSRDGANVLYWSSPVKGGKPTGSHELAGSYTFDNTSKSGSQTINPHKYRWESAGLRSLVEPVVLSNLEELWIATELFACPVYEKYYRMLVGMKPGQVAAAEFLFAILEHEISTPSKPRTIKDTFPLLRSIVVVSTPPQLSDFHRCAVRTDGVKALLEVTAPGKRRSIGETPAIMQQIADGTGFGFAVCPVPTGDITKFSLGDYLFDELYLAKYKAAILRKYVQQPNRLPTPESESVLEPDKKQEPVKQHEPEKQTSPTPPNTNEDSLLETIMAMEAEFESAAVIKQALYAYKQAHPDYFKRQIPLLPSDVREKYSAAFN